MFVFSNAALLRLTVLRAGSHAGMEFILIYGITIDHLNQLDSGPMGKTATPSATSETPLGSLDLGPLPGLVGYMLRRAQIAMFKDFIETCATVDIRPILYAILTVIDRNPGVRQGEVGAVLGIKRSNFVSLLNELEARNLATRTRHATDGRSYALHLTAEGAAAVRRLNALVAGHERRLLDTFGKDGRDRLIDMLDRIPNLYP